MNGIYQQHTIQKESLMKAVIISTVFAMLFALSSTSYADKKERVHKVLGKVTKIEGKSITFIKPRKEDNVEHTVTVNDNSIIEIDGNKATLAELKLGMLVIIDADKEKIVRSIVESKKKKKKKKK